MAGDCLEETAQSRAECGSGCSRTRQRAGSAFQGPLQGAYFVTWRAALCGRGANQQKNIRRFVRSFTYTACDDKQHAVVYQVMCGLTVLPVQGQEGDKVTLMTVH